MLFINMFMTMSFFMQEFKRVSLFLSQWLSLFTHPASEGGVYLGRDFGAIDPKRLQRLDRFTRLSVICMMVLTYFGLRWRGCEMDVSGWESYTGGVGFILALALHVTYRRVAPNLALAALTALLCDLMIAPLATTTFTYMASALGGEDYSLLIADLDRWLGFDWLTNRQAMITSPVMTEVFGAAYNSFQLQFFALPLLLFLCGGPAQARLFMNCFILGVVPVAVAATLVPTVDALLWFKQLPADSRGYTGYAVVDHYLMLRQGVMTKLRLVELEGILTFPSFHAVAGCLFAGFSTALGPLRFAFLGLNALLLAATPGLGGHYLVDVLAGIVIGVGLIAAAQAYTRRRPGPGKIHSLP